MFRGPRNENTRDPLVKRLTTINTSIEAGGFVSYGIDLDNPGERIEVSVRPMFDIANGHNGYTIDIFF